MTDDLTEKSVAELLEKFLTTTLAQDAADKKSRYAQYNRLFKQMQLLVAELKARPGDARRELARYFQHPNAQVRVQAAIYCLALLPLESRQVLQRISDRNEFPQAADATGIMMAIDAGRYVPD